MDWNLSSLIFARLKCLSAICYPFLPDIDYLNRCFSVTEDDTHWRTHEMHERARQAVDALCRMDELIKVKAVPSARSL